MTQRKLTNIKTNSQQPYFQNFYSEDIEMHNQIICVLLKLIRHTTSIDISN
jgi:hypothetical protein